jgi:hypothetical protein
MTWLVKATTAFKREYKLMQTQEFFNHEPHEQTRKFFIGLLLRRMGWHAV